MFYDIFESLCKQHGTSPFAVCKEIGLAGGTAAYWKKSGRPPKRETLEAIAEHFGVSVDYLLGRAAPSSNISAVYAENIRMVPVYESVSAGFGAHADNQVIDYCPFIISSEHEAAETIAIRVSGDSMRPKIEDGDIIRVHKQESVDSGSIAVVLLDGEEGLVKKVVYGDTWIELHSVNPYYPVRRFDGEEVLRIRVVGLVKGIFREF